jgi:hypothetical protein
MTKFFNIVWGTSINNKLVTYIFISLKNECSERFAIGYPNIEEWVSYGRSQKHLIGENKK